MSFDYKALNEQKMKIHVFKEEVVQFLSSREIPLQLPSFGFRTTASSLQELRVAAIMDEFTLNCFQPECKLLEVSPDHFEQELAEFQPDMLFVESAWSGNHGLWKGKIAHGSREYFALVTYCQQRQIPIVFWNKEDPVHFDDFLVIAKTADFVFTTDNDKVPIYRSKLGHDRIYHLHFAAQPRIHNPIEKYNRQDKFCFAGAYYRCYPKRAELFDKFADVFLAKKGLDIYDREYGNKCATYQFPSKYKACILGKLDCTEIDKAYKGYNYGVNMNTITSSSTMFARRVFEMMASNTITVGNYAKGLENYFGELTICTDDVDELQKKLQKYCSDEASLHKYRLLGLREILSKHLYEDRLNDIVNKVFHLNRKKPLPVVTVISQAQNEQECKWIIEEFKSQIYHDKKLFLFYKDKLITELDFTGKYTPNAINRSMQETVMNGFVAYFSPQDYYAPYYLYDLMYTLRYCDAQAIGKNCFYRIDNATLQQTRGEMYCWGNSIALRRSIVSTENIQSNSFFSFINQGWISHKSIFYTDEWNYCQDTVGNKCMGVEVMDITSIVEVNQP